MPRLRYSVSATTRAPRPGEIDGVAYHFMTPKHFHEVAESDGFLETKVYNGNHYGTPRSYVEQNLAEGYDLIMKPDVDGALAVQRAFPQAALIFVLPNKFSYLRERLEARRTETNEEIAARLGIAHEEIAQVRAFDYLVINEQSNPIGAVDDLEAILRAERHRIHRYDDVTLRRLEHS
jgi:guanylate kinase